MDISSASLLSPAYQLSNDGYNNIRNSVALGGVHLSHLSLLPVLDSSLIRYAYHRIANQPDMSVEHIGQQSGCHFFFYKSNNQVWHVISNEDVDEIYLAEVAQIEMWVLWFVNCDLFVNNKFYVRRRT